MKRPEPKFHRGDKVKMDSDGKVFTITSSRWDREYKEWMYGLGGVLGDNFSEYEFTREVPCDTCGEEVTRTVHLQNAGA